VLAGLGEERGETTVDVLVDLGTSSSFRRAGVGGVDWFGLVLPRDIGRFLLQSPSSAGTAGRVPNLLPPPDGGGASSDGLNLDPIVQVSPSAPEVESPPPNPPLLWGRPSESPECVLGGTLGRLVDRQSLLLSERLGGGGCLSPSNRRWEESRESLKSGSGPSRLHGPANLASSSKPPGPPMRSLAVLECALSFHYGQLTRTDSRGSATLTRTIRLAKFCPLFAKASFRPSMVVNSM